LDVVSLEALESLLDQDPLVEQSGSSTLAVAQPSRWSFRLQDLVPKQARQWLEDNTDARLRGLLLLNAMTLLMGSNWVVIKESAVDMDPWIFTSLRFTLAAAAFLPFLQR
jgi:hypothetical protein